MLEMVQLQWYAKLPHVTGVSGTDLTHLCYSSKRPKLRFYLAFGRA